MATKVGQDLFKAYAEHIVKALWHIAKNLGLQEISPFFQAFVVPDSRLCFLVGLL